MSRALPLDRRGQRWRQGTDPCCLLLKSSSSLESPVHWFLTSIHSFMTLTTGCDANVWVFFVLNSREKHPISESVLKEASAMATRAPVLVQGVAILHTKAGDRHATPLPSGHSDCAQQGLVKKKCELSFLFLLRVYIPKWMDIVFRRKPCFFSFLFNKSFFITYSFY